MSTLTHPLQHISGKDHNRCLRRSWRHCQHRRQNNHQFPLCWWHWWLNRRGRRTGKFIWVSQQSLHSLHHRDHCREDQANDKQHQWHQHRDQGKWTEAWDCHKLQVPGLSYNWWGFQAWDTLQDSTDNSSTDKVETSLGWHEYFLSSQIRLMRFLVTFIFPVCLWIVDPRSRAPKKNTSHGNEVLLQDTTHLI